MMETSDPDIGLQTKLIIKDKIVPELEKKYEKINGEDFEQNLLNDIPKTLEDDPDTLDIFNKNPLTFASEVKTYFLSSQKPVAAVTRGKPQDFESEKEKLIKKLVAEYDIKAYNMYKKDLTKIQEILKKALGAEFKRMEKLEKKFKDIEEENKAMKKDVRFLKLSKINYYVYKIPVINWIIKKIKKPIERRARLKIRKVQENQGNRITILEATIGDLLADNKNIDARNALVFNKKEAGKTTCETEMKE